MQKTHGLNPDAADIILRLSEAGLKPPKTVTLAVTHRCNLNCRHCWPESGPDSNTPVVPSHQVLDLMAGFAALGAERIVITGGEPLTHPYWFDMLSFACSRPEIKEVRLQTNAVLITPAHVDAFLSLKDKGLIIQTSLDGASAATHDRLRGPGSFERTLTGLRLLKAEGMASRVCIAFTEMRHNFEDIPDLLEMADEMGAFQFVTGTVLRCGRAGQGGLLPPSRRQYERLLSRYRSDETFRNRYHRIGNIAALEWFRDRSEVAAACCSFIETSYVTADGRLYPCVMLHADDFAAPGVYGRLLTAAVSERIDSWSRLQQISRDRLTRLAPCRNCGHYRRCGGGCMGRAYQTHGELLSVEDRCGLRKTVYHNRS